MKNQTDELSLALQQMQNNLQRISEEHSERIWLQTSKNNLNEKLISDKPLKELSKEIVDFFISQTSALLGTMYVLEDNAYNLQYAYGIKGQPSNSFLLGEGLVGQSAEKKSMMLVNSMPQNYFKIESSLGSEKPDALAIIPTVFDNKTVAVIELGKFGQFSPIQLKLIEEASEAIAININTVAGKKNLENLINQLTAKEQELNNRITAINKSNACIEFDTNGTILSANEIFLNIIGYTEQEIIGMHHSIFIEKEYAASKEYRQFWSNLKKGEFQQEEFKRVHKNGEIIWLQGSYNPILDSNGKPNRIFKIATDVTPAKKQQLEIDAITTAIYKSNMAVEFDLNGIILKANDIFLDTMGYREKEIIGKHHSFFVERGYEKSKEYAEFWNDLKRGEYQEGEFKRISKNDDIVWIKGNYNPILDTQGRPYKILKIATDITLAKKQAEELALQAEELQSQQEELKQMNEELEEQAQNLKQQQEELQMTNEELEEQTLALQEKNKEVEASRIDIEQKTKQLEISSKYKSEFLANMSHELRTPLNSLLILSKDLADNKKGNLNTDQVESAQIINKSGQDLLALINDVLDLSKIEAGKMVVNIGRVSLKEFAANLQRNFKHITDKKGLDFTVTIGEGLPEAVRTDEQRLDQIIKNLMSNAIKFTEKGSIRVSIEREDENNISLSVKDTGIGIPAEKQLVIFEAFQQADGSTSRKYGGTGLGLSISRDLVNLLGGKIKLSSKVSEGSSFTIIIPMVLTDKKFYEADEPLKKEEYVPQVVEKNKIFINYPTIKDDREKIEKNDKSVLIIEDDLKFAEILLKQANAKMFKCLSAATGEDGLMLADQYKPDAIILDMELPGMNGRSVLKELKANPATRHIPVHIISMNERSLDSIKEGAIEYLTKPVDKKQLEGAFNRIGDFINRKTKNLLLVEDDENSRKVMKKLIGNGDVKCIEASTGKEAINLFKENHIDCIILDLGLPDINGFSLIHELEKAKKAHIPPIVIYTGRELSKEENYELQKYSESIIIKGVKSEERLLDETALFLHRTVSNLPESKQKIITSLYDKESIFADKKILVVDDDMRNVFALSKVLKERKMQITKAENGIVALDILNQDPKIDLVLMDIMMPEMDGYEAMQKIRAQPRFNKLPIIALTAKAMRDDKQKCIDAGANDYISKPVDIDQLLSLMRIWLSK
ncbi:MAG TPA: response regulator [Cyclobacteriaceae bacterium]